MSDFRNTIFVEDCVITQHETFPDSQFVLQLKSERIAQTGLAGQFVHIQCHPRLELRRPFSIMRTSQDHFEILYKVVGEGSRALSHRQPGESISVLGPIGRPFSIDQSKTLPLLIGGGVGIPPMIFLAQHYHQQYKDIKPFIIMGSEVRFPFTSRPSGIVVPGVPDGAIAAMPLMEDWGFASRLASLQDFPGCFSGYVTDLARSWLSTLDGDSLKKDVVIYSCGPHAMLHAVHQLAKEFSIPCQVSLEEYMACGIGGCAGCTVAVETPQGTAMKRVCVDGPVFESRQVFSEH